jgi:acetyl esterase/lipase
MGSVGRRILLAAIVGCASAGLAGCAPRTVYGTRGFSVDRIGNIAYYDGEDASFFKHKLDIYQPEGVTNAPVLLFIHGGGWRIGDKMFDTNIGKTFAKHGVLTFAIDYRLSPEVKHPEHIRDCARAFHWIRQHAREYGGNPDDVFLTGHSSGAHLAALLALNEKYLAEVGESTDSISGVMPGSGVYLVGSSGLLFGAAFDGDPDILRDASPTMQVDDKQPPFLIIYGSEDAMGIDILSINLAHELEKHHSPVELLHVEGYGHGDTVWEIGKKNDPITRAMLRFMRTYSRTLNAPDPDDAPIR